jgi:hypothetical protein
MPKLIALYSPAPGCGKTTIANFLCSQHGFKRVGLADPMRAMLRALLEDYGHTMCGAANFLARDKEKPTVLPYRPTARHMLRTLGTEWGRTCIGPKFWTEIWRSKVDEWLEDEQSVVCDDLRFPEELDAVLDLGGEVWRIERPGHEATPDEDGHASDGALEGYHQIWHQRIRNDGTEDMLLQYADCCLRMELDRWFRQWCDSTVA